MSAPHTDHATPDAHGHHDAHGHGGAEAPKKWESPVVHPEKSGLFLFTGGEWGWIATVIGLLAGSMFAVSLVMATVVALCHKLFKLFMDDQVAAANWGNAVGTVVMIVLVFVMVLATLLTMGERKWSAFIQDRMGPNKARIALPGLKDKSLFGFPHIAADVLKMLTKEEVVPAMGNKLMFHLAPAIAFGSAFVLFAVVPMSPSFDWLGEHINMTVIRNDWGLLYVFAIASMAVFGVTLAGWASNNKFALLGGVRATAQMVSYEVTLGLTLVGLMIIFGTLRLDLMTEAQGGYALGLPMWGVLFQPLAIIGYFAAASAEMKRPPFDLPEGESEIVGYFIEYSGLKFGLFMIAELVEVVVFAGLFTALFFGGWHIPYFEADVAALVGPSWMGIVYVFVFMTKTVFFCWLSLVVRWSFPRFRYDQVMDLCWKILLPASIVNVVLTGVVTLAWGTEGAMAFGLVQLAFVLSYLIGAIRIARKGGETLFGPAAAPAAPAHH